jgi:hypothetical protein
VLTVSFWAVKGEHRFVQLDWAGAKPTPYDDDDDDDDDEDDEDDDDDDDDDVPTSSSGAPLVRLEIPPGALAFYPDGTPFGEGDSVLITVTMHPTHIRVRLQPHGLRFSASDPPILQLWYGAAGGDLNGDGRVNWWDRFIERRWLGVRACDGGSGHWYRIPAEHSLREKWFRAPLAHFSGYEVSW